MRLGKPLLNGRVLPVLPRQGVLVVDDIIDSGATRMRYTEHAFAAVVGKGQRKDFPGASLTYEAIIKPASSWVVFWWEQGTESGGPEDNVRRLLQLIGEDPNRPGLRDTPARVVRSYKELFAGYHQDVGALLRQFPNEESYDELVLVRGVPFYSACEHHMLPFFGTADIGYIPNKERYVGLSKLARVLEVFAKRLQVQERLTVQVAGALMQHLNPVGAVCRVRAQHLCMCARGVNKPGSETVTQCLRGVFLEDTPFGIAARQELMATLNSK